MTKMNSAQKIEANLKANIARKKEHLLRSQYVGAALQKDDAKHDDKIINKALEEYGEDEPEDSDDE